jgi:hypothetical protein
MKKFNDDGELFDDTYSNEDMDQYYHEVGWTGFVYPSATWKEIEEATKMINLRQEPHRQVEATPEDWLDTWCFIRDLKSKKVKRSK